MNIFLAELEVLNPETMRVETLRFSSGDGGFMTLPSDNPANAFYEPRLKLPHNFECKVFADGLVGGSSDGGCGSAQFLNLDGALDYLSGYAFDGRLYRLLRVDADAAYSTAVVVFSGTMTQPEFFWSTMDVKIRDYTEFFDRALSQHIFLGNNVGTQGLEGTPDDLMGKTKPLGFGFCRNVSPAWVNSSLLVLMLHCGPIKEVLRVLAEGIELALDTSCGTDGDCADLDALQDAAPSSDGYCTCLALGLIKLGGYASSAITVDFRGCNQGGVYAKTFAEIFERIVTGYLQRQRTNILPYSEDRANAIWSPLAATVVAGTPPTSPQDGMTAHLLTETTNAGPHGIAQTVSQATGLYCYSDFVLPTANRYLFRIELVSHADADNFCQVDINAKTGEVLAITTSGTAVGPQYTATGFVTDGGVIYHAGGWVRLWVSGQPDETFSQFDVRLVLLKGDPDDYTADYAGEGAAVWIAGAQLEVEAAPTLYTGPTTTDPVSGYDPPTRPEIDADALAAFTESGAAPAELGYYVATGEDVTAGDVLGALADSVGAFWADDRYGRKRLGVLSLPASSATPVATFVETESLVDTIESVAPFDGKNGAPIWTVSMNTVKNWTAVDKNDLATSLWSDDPALVLWLTQEWRTVTARDVSILGVHPLAEELSFTSFISNQTEALAEAKRRLAYYSGFLQRFVFDVKIEALTDAEFEALVVGSVIRLQLDRWGLAEGKNFLVIGLTETFETGHITVEVMG